MMKTYLTCLMLTVVIVAGCRSDSDEPDATPQTGGNGTPAGQTPNTGGTPGPDTPPGSGTPLASGTPTGNLVLVEGPYGSYSIMMPDDWEVDNEAFPGGFISYFRRFIGEGQIIGVQVRCEIGRTVDEMIEQDQRLFAGLGGRFEHTGTTQVAGQEAVTYDAFVTPAGIPGEQHWIYLVNEPCGWRIALQSLGEGILAQFEGAFSEVLASFQPKNFEVTAPAPTP
jgi:hypothetical protein